MQRSEISKQLNDLLPDFGIMGSLKIFQEQCIMRILADKKDVFCIQNTGAGKSVCYTLFSIFI